MWHVWRSRKLPATAQPITDNMLRVNEIFKSIQGESTFAGCLCTFIRLSGCNLSCLWCDTSYAQEETSTEMCIEEIISEVKQLGINMVEITGGEPLMQTQTPQLCSDLLKNGYKVLIETNGSQDIGLLPPGVRRVVDVKCPGSGEGDSFLMSNLQKFSCTDEVKFVIASLEDAQWAEQFTLDHKLINHCTVIFSPVISSFPPAQLAEYIVRKNLNVRFGLQLHKVLWGDKRGV